MSLVQVVDDGGSNESVSVMIDVQTENKGGLTIRSAVASDSGTYACYAVNKAGQKKAPTKVVVTPWSPFRNVKEITAGSTTVVVKVIMKINFILF
jgi:hypothetical protein